MNGNRGRYETEVPNGSLLRLGEKREIAIYQRGCVVWIADFRGGRGELFTAGEWFAFNGRRSVLHRADLDSITPLPAYVIEKIERMHGMEKSVSIVALATRLLERVARFWHELSCRPPRMQRS